MPTIAEFKGVPKVLSRQGCLTLLEQSDAVWPQHGLTLMCSQGRQCQPESGQGDMKMYSLTVHVVLFR